MVPVVSNLRSFWDHWARRLGSPRLGAQNPPRARSVRDSGVGRSCSQPTPGARSNDRFCARDGVSHSCARCVRKVSFAFFNYPIGASGIDPGRIDFKRGANPSTTPFFEGGLHLNYSRWFYRTRPTLMSVDFVTLPQDLSVVCTTCFYIPR